MRISTNILADRANLAHGVIFLVSIPVSFLVFRETNLILLLLKSLAISIPSSIIFGGTLEAGKEFRLYRLTKRPVDVVPILIKIFMVFFCIAGMAYAISVLLKSAKH